VRRSRGCNSRAVTAVLNGKCYPEVDIPGGSPTSDLRRYCWKNVLASKFAQLWFRKRNGEASKIQEASVTDTEIASRQDAREFFNKIQLRTFATDYERQAAV